MHNSLGHTLTDFEASPPPGAWDRLMGELEKAEEVDLAHRLQDFSPQPPPHNWGTIAAQLGTASVAGFAERLQQFEAAPPAGVFEAVQVALQPAKVVHIRRAWRYAAAAAVIGVGIGFFALLPNPELDALAPGVANAPQPLAPDKVDNVPTVAQEPNFDITTRPDRHLAASTASTKNKTQRSETSSVPVTASDANLQTFNPDALPISQYAQSTTASISHHTPTVGANAAAKTYYLKLGATGNLINVSQKLAAMECIFDEESKDVASAQCSSELQQRKQQIAASPMYSSSGNIHEVAGFANSAK